MTEVSHRLRHHGKHHQNELWRVTDLRDVMTTSSPPPAVDRTSTCYTTNEVLMIIGLTCVLNLAFLALVMTCVHFCSSPALTKIANCRLESILVDGTSSDSDLDEIERKKNTMFNAYDSYPLDSRLAIENYVKSFTVPLQVVVPQPTASSLQRLGADSPPGMGPRPRLKTPAPSLSMECLLFV